MPGNFWEEQDRILGALTLGTMSLPQALWNAWSAGREAERLDNLRMLQAEREARRSGERGRPPGSGRGR